MEKVIIIYGVVVVIGLLIGNFLKEFNTQKAKEQGQKTKGYIYDIEPWDDGYNSFPKGAIKVYVDGKIRRIAEIEITEKYKELYNKINETYKEKEKINIKCIPVDVYIYNDQATVDIESAEV